MKTKTAVLNGKPDAGNPHVRFDEGEVASAKPRRGSLLYKKLLLAAVCGLVLCANARTITVTENKTEGVVSSHTLTFSAGEGWLLGLYRAYAPSDCGETMADWPMYERVAPIPSSLDTYTTDLPAGWGKTVFAVRYFLMEEEIAPPYDSRVDYIESTKNEYVLTGVSATPSTRFVLKMSDPDTFQGNGNGSAFGAKSGGSGQPGDDRFCITTGNVGNWTHAFSWLCGSYNSGAATGSKFTLQKMAVISNDAAKVYYNGKQAFDGSATANFTGSGELAIFAVRVNTATPTYEYDKIRLHGLEIYEGDVLVRNFLPVVTNGVYLLYETVDGKFYNNSRNNGEKRFLGGERIPTGVGALTPHAASQAMVRAEPSANILVTSSGMTLRAFGKTLYRLADGADAVDVYLAYAKKNETLPEPTCVWTGWKDELQTRFNIAIPGLEPSTTYAYSIYVTGGGKRSERYTGTFTTGKIITIASDVSPLVIGATIAKGDEIRIGAGVHAVTSTIQIGVPRVAIVGMGETPADTVLDAGFAANMRIVYSAANNYVLLRNLTFANALKNVIGDKEGGAYYAAHGAAVRLTNAIANEKLAHYHWIESCAFSGCTNTVQYGGAVHVDGAAEFVNCDFSDCRSTCGGAVFVHCGGEQTRFRSCTFARNSSSDRGGAVACRTYSSSTSDATYDGAENRFGMLFDACTFTDNVATGSGGALSGKIVALRDCTFAGNTAASGGGFNVQTWNGTCRIRTFTNVIERCVFSNNVARTGSGGAIYENETRCIALKGSTFVGNRSYGSGSSAVLAVGSLEAEDTVFVGNRSEEETRYNGMKYFGAPQDWISVRLDGYPAEDLPAVYADGTMRKVVVRHEVPNLRDVHGPNGYPFLLTQDGELTVRLRSWDGSLVRTLGTKKPPKYWSFGQEISFPLDMKGVKPGAYVVTAELPPHIREAGVFNPTNTGNGCIGLSMLYGRNAMRLAVFPNTEPGKIFGVGNGMVHNGLWWSGCTLANTLEARDLRPVLVGEGDVYHDAILGCPGTEGVIVDALGPTVPAMNNPAAKMLDIFSEPGRAELKRRAEKMGRRLGRNAGVAAVNLGNEAPSFNRGAVCPTAAADASFRAFCRSRYKGDLKALNAAWQKAFGSWGEVCQPIYAEFGRAQEKTGAAAIDWYANMGRTGEKLVKHLNRPENVEMAMDWYRWRTKESIRMYADYVAVAKTYDKKTVYSNNYCWPNFFAHLVLPTWRRMDGAMLDCQYVCAFPRTLGSNAQMIEILEMTESAMKGKPIIGREIYVQPHYPAEMVALQNWAMVAHGMRANLVFGWKPYSDHGQKVFKAGPRAWERKEDAVSMWMLIDTDGTRLPAYAGVKRSAEEIAAFHAKYDGLSIRRTRGRVAVYLSDETSMYTMLKTGDRPYLERTLCHTRDWLADELRLAGVRIEYLDDETIDELTRTNYDIVVIPPMPRVAPGPAAQLAAFEKAGGKAIRLAGKDTEFIPKHPELPRSAWFEPADGGKRNVEVVVRTQAKTGRRFVFVLNRGKAVKGALFGTDFAKSAEFTDALTGERSGRDLVLGDYGYRVLILE